MTIINRKKSRTVVKIQLTSMSILKIEKIKSIIQKTIIRTFLIEVIVAFFITIKQLRVCIFSLLQNIVYVPSQNQHHADSHLPAR